MSLPTAITFASDAAIMAAWGVVMLLFAALCALMERRRLRRAQIDNIGWVPWNGLLMTFAIIGVGLLAVALPGVASG